MNQKPSRIEGLRQTARTAAVSADEAENVLESLRILMRAAGVSAEWAQPEPMGVDAAFANVVLCLTNDAPFSGHAADTAARDLIDEYLTD